MTQHARSRAIVCPVCGLAAGPAPFCLRDGALLGQEPFVVGARYRVEAHLGSGATAHVFAARHLILGRSCALKVLRPDLALHRDESARFLRQARIAAQLDQENIVTVSDFGRDDELDLFYLAMDRLVGPTLAQVIEREGPLPWTRCIGILTQLCRALDAAHGQGVVHRDLKPRNVMLVSSSGRNDVLRLCDFGLSRQTGDQRITSTGVVVGSPAYMAPEQIEGTGAPGAAADLYSLGAVAYEMLTGRLPHEGATAVAVIARKISEPPVPLSEREGAASIPPELSALIHRCLERDPTKRPSSAAEVERALHAIAPHGGGSAATLPVGDLVDQVIGSYRITRLLGTGGAGSVFLAEHPVIHTRVAIKVLLPEVARFPGVLDRFIQEARTTGEIGDPRLPRYHDFGYLPDGRPYAAMEYLEGETLAERIATSGPLPWEQALAVILDVAEAVGRAHAVGIIHRDLKPENIFLCGSAGEGTPAVKVLDFGVAKILAPESAAAKTLVGAVVGTVAYAPPEQLLAQPVDATADVYALGVTLFETLTGDVPFDGEVSDVISAKVQGTIPSLREQRPDVPRAIDDVLGAMLAPRAAARPATMADVVERLRILDAPPSPLAPLHHARPWTRSAGTPRLAWLMALFVVCALIGGVTVAAFVTGAEPRIAATVRTPKMARGGSPKGPPPQESLAADPRARSNPSPSLPSERAAADDVISAAAPARRASETASATAHGTHASDVGSERGRERTTRATSERARARSSPSSSTPARPPEPTPRPSAADDVNIVSPF